GGIHVLTAEDLLERAHDRGGARAGGAGNGDDGMPGRHDCVALRYGRKFPAATRPGKFSRNSSPQPAHAAGKKRGFCRRAIPTTPSQQRGEREQAAGAEQRRVDLEAVVIAVVALDALPPRARPEYEADPLMQMLRNDIEHWSEARAGPPAGL